MPEPKGPKPFVPGLLQIKSNWTVDTSNWGFIFHVLKTIASAWSGADITTVLGLFTTGLADYILPQYGAAVTNVSNVGLDLSSAMGLEVSGEGAGGGTKSASVSPMPINCALRVNWPPTLRYRGGRPGVFMFGGDNADRQAGSANMFSTATRASWISEWGNLITLMTGTPLTGGAFSNPVWVSYFTKYAFREPPLTFIIPTGIAVEVQQRVCSRRRRLGRGVPGE